MPPIKPKTTANAQKQKENDSMTQEKKTVFKIYGQNHRFFAYGWLPEEYPTREAAEQGVKDNLWIMDDWDIQEVTK